MAAYQEYELRIYGVSATLLSYVPRMCNVCTAYRTCHVRQRLRIFIVLSHYRVSTHVSTAYQDTKGTSRVRRTYVSIRSSYSSIRSSYSSYAEVLRFLCVHLKIRSTYVTGPIRRTYVTHTWYIRKQRGRYAVDT